MPSYCETINSDFRSCSCANATGKSFAFSFRLPTLTGPSCFSNHIQISFVFSCQCYRLVFRATDANEYRAFWGIPEFILCSRVLLLPTNFLFPRGLLPDIDARGSFVLLKYSRISFVLSRQCYGLVFFASSSPLSALANRSGFSKYSRVSFAFSRRCYRLLSRVLFPTTDANDSLVLSSYPRRSFISPRIFA